MAHQYPPVYWRACPFPGTWRGDDLAAHNRSTILPAEDDSTPLWTVWLVPAAWVPPSQMTPSAEELVEGSMEDTAKWL